MVLLNQQSFLVHMKASKLMQCINTEKQPNQINLLCRKKKRGPDSHLVTEENLKLIYIGSNLRQTCGTKPRNKALCRDHHWIWGMNHRYEITENLRSGLQPGILNKVSKGAKISSRYNQVPHPTQNTNGSYKLTVRHHKREPRGQPFSSRWPQSTFKQTRTKT